MLLDLALCSLSLLTQQLPLTSLLAYYYEGGYCIRLHMERVGLLLSGTIYSLIISHWLFSFCFGLVMQMDTCFSLLLLLSFS